MYPFREGSFAVRNGWYVAAFAHEVTRTLLSRTILNQPVVLYRKEDGQAVAVGGRCPHRHFPLGASHLKGDAIECGYHGITFGADGRCVKAPTMESIPRRFTIPSYPLVEHGMWMFIWMGDPDKADTAMLPDLAQTGETAPGITAEPFVHMQVNGRYQLLQDNLLDLSHLAFLHKTSIGNIENAVTPEETVSRPGFLSSRRYIKGAPIPPATAAAIGYHGLADRLSRIDFYLPGFHASILEITYPADHPEHPSKVITGNRSFHAVTPETHKTCHYFFGAAAFSPTFLEQMKTFLKPVLDEDKFATEEIEKMLALVGENPTDLLLKTDRNAVEARRMLQAMMDAEAADGAS